ncbi:MAG TPA: hypothetical protein OIM63_03350 [Bacilli bacterium]|nr:hypothetical protein [Bacilli bacterium]
MKLSTKDVSYISDIFNWNMNCFNVCCRFKKVIQDEKALQIITELETMHKNTCKTMLKLVK